MADGAALTGVTFHASRVPDVGRRPSVGR
jgi:hypothetical protein